jgi:hypothetical protein
MRYTDPDSIYCPVCYREGCDCQERAEVEALEAEYLADECGEDVGTAAEFEALEERDALLQLDALLCPRCGCLECDCLNIAVLLTANPSRVAA